MQDRFKQLLEEKRLTATRFASLIKVNASAMSHILNGRSKPGFDVLDKIAQAFPDINLNWLISGKGELYNSSSLINTSKLLPEPDLFSTKTVCAEETTLIPPIQKKIYQAVVAENKKIKRIILFFEDGSFDDYEK